MDTTRQWERWISLALIGCGPGIAVWLLRHGVRVTQEDGYYYYKIAQQMAHGAGSTFDGLHPTNGYHPLWLLCLTPIFRIAPSAATTLTLGVLLQGLLLGGCNALVYRTARTALGSSAAALAALVWLGLTYREALSGLEFALHALCVLAAAHYYLSRFQKLPKPTEKSYGVLGLLLGLTFLARLDTLLLGVVLAVSLFLRERQAGWTRGSLRRLMAYALPVIALCLLYLGIELRVFGHPWPISGVIKQEWSAALLAQDPLYRAHGWLAAKSAHLLWPLYHLKTHYPITIGGYIVPLLLALLSIPRQERDAQTRFVQSVWPFAVYSVAQLIATALVYHGDLSEKPWYYVIQPWLTALLAGLLFQRLADACTARKQPTFRLSTLLRAALLMLWCVPPLMTLRTLQQWETRSHSADDHEELVEAALWIDANLPPDAVIGAWNAGTIGFLSGRRVVNLDGLVNTWDYDQVKRHDLCGYFQKTGITYLVDAFENGKVLTYASGSVDYAPCVGQWERIWSDHRPVSSWHMEAYRLAAPR